MPYTHTQHRRNFAIWAAASAIRRTKDFNVTMAQALIQGTRLAGIGDELRAIPPDQEAFDALHRSLRREILSLAQEKGLGGLTHGIAQKLVNMYLKAMHVCATTALAMDRLGEDDRTRLAVIHPPIDRVLLTTLESKARKGEIDWDWRCHAGRSWMKMDSNGYDLVIGDVKRLMKGRPLWMVEEYWRPSAAGPDDEKEAG